MIPIPKCQYNVTFTFKVIYVIKKSDTFKTIKILCLIKMI